MFGELAFPDINLAAPAHRPATTNRINVNAQLPRRTQQICAFGNLALTARRGEHNFDISHVTIPRKRL